MFCGGWAPFYVDTKYKKQMQRCGGERTQELSWVDSSLRVLCSAATVFTAVARARERERWGCSTAGGVKTGTTPSSVKNVTGDRVNAARLEYTHGTMFEDTTTSRRRVPVKSAIPGGRALKQQSLPGLRFSGGWTIRG